MSKPKLKIANDIDAAAIGALYREAQRGIGSTAHYLIETGQRLVEKRGIIPQGEWLPWVESNAEVLGFSQKTCLRLLQLGRRFLVVNVQFTNEEANGVVSSIWGNIGRHGNLKGEYEWYTPEEIIEAARSVMGGIDLDPASCEFANRIVKAEKFYCEDDDGLKKEWIGRVWINPPFAHPAVKHFAEKLMESLGGGVEQAVWLSNATVDVVWWQKLAEIGICCFHRGRIKFYGPEEDLQPPTLGQSIFYFGDNREKFREVFSKFGVVLS
jgi:phage N-6-adenine-methyltransferase